MTSNPDNHLSPLGHQRRAEMLDHLLCEMRLLHRRRRNRRRIAAVALPMLAITMTSVMWQGSSMFLRQQQPKQSPHAAHHDSSSAAPEMSATPAHPATPSQPAPHLYITFTSIQTDPDIVARYRATPSSIVEIIDDATLAETLAEIGRAAGVIRVADRVWLTQDVTDHIDTRIPDKPQSQLMNAWPGS